ncbi:hypothetical protein FOMG_19685 [Fusarium oxysporum f. sp. melonis 26406]|uniref:Uncharacterized protein n=1 Tax=Fusarium oxysporum f. sp. melonis 26406 TaxID=1089452 RepID=W9Z5N9_FUSOX|nr:hypothetical protein FOMG_19685 [Fusarium oxysporum f. sp. melonis 26406]
MGSGVFFHTAIHINQPNVPPQVENAEPRYKRQTSSSRVPCPPITSNRRKTEAHIQLENCTLKNAEHRAEYSEKRRHDFPAERTPG